MAQVAPAAGTRSWDDPSRMVGVDAARDRILAAFAPLPAVPLPLDDALGLVLASPVVADANLPPFANAAMDGFAVRTADTRQATPDVPVTLHVIGQAAAGYVTDLDVVAGTAVRIMTGAPIPAGADAVVRFEETDETESRCSAQALLAAPASRVEIRHAPRPWANVRPAGEDVRAGETVLAAGTHLRAAHLGLLAALGRTEVTVHRRPRVAILATGDEIVDPGAEVRPGQIRNSNGTMVAALVRRYGGEPIMLGVARDTADDLRQKLRSASSADLLITIGGVSVGDYDLVKEILRAEGRIDLWQVRLKPGKPLAFGWIGATPLLGLPGNPVAAAVAFEQFARPAMLTLLGRTDLALPTIFARLGDRIENRGGRRHFVRVRVDATPAGYVARLAGAQGAGILSSLARANGLLVIPAEIAVAEPDSMLPVQMLDWEHG